MNATTSFPAEHPDAAMARARAAWDHHDWTPERQCRFLEQIADGRLVEQACAAVGMPVDSAHAFRRSAPGRPFALGWQAASLLARDAVHDLLMRRVVLGCEETVTRANGETVTRRRHDTRLALAMLARLDDHVAGRSFRDLQAQRSIAQEFDSYVDTIAEDVPGRATAFVAERLSRKWENEKLEPLRALERADRDIRAIAAQAAEPAGAGEAPTAPAAEAPNDDPPAPPLPRAAPAPDGCEDSAGSRQQRQLRAASIATFLGAKGPLPPPAAVHALAEDDDIAAALRDTILRGLETRFRIPGENREVRPAVPRPDASEPVHPAATPPR